VTPVPRIELAPGYSISRVLKGGWQLAGGHGTVDRRDALDDMARFVDAGLTTFDCADIYTGVEELIGEFLRESPGRRAKVEVHTKCAPDLAALATLTAAQIEAGIDRSLVRLGVERLDLVQFHWWDYDVPGWLELGATLERLRERGKIRHLGVTNFDTAHVAAYLDAGVPLVANQVQYSLLDRRPEPSMIPLCAKAGVGLLCYGALAGGFLAERWLNVPEPPWPHENRSRTKYHLIIGEFGGWSLFQELLTTLDAVAKRHEATIGAVAIRHVLDRPQVAGVIVGATSSRYLDDTCRACALDLDADERRRIQAVLDRATGPGGEVFGLERRKGDRHARIMRTNLQQGSGLTGSGVPGSG
jgi:aryl-alcohol dehydrogenase-like predicted oxidoreductase